jgi:hypothetical protein
MALGNEASTGPRIAKLKGYRTAWVRRIIADARGLGPLPRPLQILLDGSTTAQALSYRRNCQNGSMNLCAVALVKQDRENDFFHIFDLEDRSECSA